MKLNQILIKNRNKMFLKRIWVMWFCYCIYSSAADPELFQHAEYCKNHLKFLASYMITYHMHLKHLTAFESVSAYLTFKKSYDY